MFADSSQRTKVKICGLTNLQDARFTSGALAHYMGFIFYEGSPRYIEPGEAGAIINWIEGPECVGVFVNQPLDDVNMIATQTGIDLVQLHGNESPEYCGLIEKQVIKAIHISDSDSETDIREKVEPYLSEVDYLLFDTKVEGLWGGTGQTFDWHLIADVADGVPFFLSGGLNVNNVRKACKIANPHAVDLSSSLESEPGEKDYDKIEAFMDEMRAIWDQQEIGEL
ncbi:phosphoribosylanthranilate isomerase [Aliifodinibius sp. S!AR15-10]|uniref:phosphoribosylanthranilate isomerase n=1 Tax=Aliifodinibius sp. S!AR15-10 TaxID=2950437 RepID=UPI00285F07A6|nr:phosphoribosylanthranilate isomerase [Aliifodinibius sp. S!AR15-10]MDR8392332.1 phosphoribosylanthranilate isomerase [Aliifodinibius sp. S!AR15-10]